MTQKKHLVMYEISQKQNYIFRTNRLLENTGGSYIIRDLTERPEELFATLEHHPAVSFKKEHKKLPEHQGQIVGGGSATYMFNRQEDAEQFARQLSANIIRYFPGIELFLTQREIDWEREYLYCKDEHMGVIREMQNSLSEKKDRRQQSVFQKSLGIHQPCVSSGLPANRLAIPKQSTNEAAEPRAEELLIKEMVGESARNDIYEERFIKDNSFLAGDISYQFMEQKYLEKLFAAGDASDDRKSYLSIISLDGNAMGLKVQQFLTQKFANNTDYIERYKEFTEAIDSAYTNAFQRTIKHVLDNRELWERSIYGDKEKNKELYEEMASVIPIRPVILSGDDVSFITFGVLGIEIARIYLQYLQQESIEITGKKQEKQTMNACAGVAIIPHRYPFWLGFQLADSLCDNGKKRLQLDAKNWQDVGYGSEQQAYDTSLIDWQLVESGGAIEDIEDFRERYFTTEDGASLSMRPYYVQQADDKPHFASYQHAFYRAMTVIQDTLKAAETNSDSTAPGRSKWKTLRDVYHQGPAAVDEWVLLNQFYALDNPEENISIHDTFFFTFHQDDEANKKGFRLKNDGPIEEGKEYAFYYDALEIFDYFVLLNEVKDR